MAPTPRTVVIPAAVVGGAIAAVILPGGLVLAVAVGLFFAVRYAIRRAEARPTPATRWMAALAVAAAVFVAPSVVWVLMLAGMTYECEFEEVRCSERAEWLAVHGEWTFLPIAVVALVLGWLVTRRLGRSELTR